LLVSFELFDTFLQVLSAISHLIFDRKDLVDYFEKHIAYLNPIIQTCTDDFLISKIINFYTFTLDDMFHDKTHVHNTEFDNSINYMFNCLQHSNDNLVLFTFDALDSLIFDESIEFVACSFVKAHFKDTFNIMQHKEIFRDSPYCCSFLNNLLSNYFDEIEPMVYGIFKHYWEYIENNFQPKLNETKTKNDVKSDNLHYIIKAIESIATIISKCSNETIRLQMNENVLNLVYFFKKILAHPLEENFLQLIIISMSNLSYIKSDFIYCVDSLFKFLIIQNKLSYTHT
jgi:hypothetical protein